MITDNDDWLYSSEAFASNYTMFDARTQEMDSLVNSFNKRKYQTENRPIKLKLLKNKIESLYELTDKLEETHPWIKPENRTIVYISLNKT